MQVKKLHKIYSNGVEALKGIDFSVERGAFVGLLGPNGAGKSTIISIINSLVRKTSGEVIINNYDMIIPPDIQICNSCSGAMI